MTQSFKKQFEELKLIGQRIEYSSDEKEIKDKELIKFLKKSIAENKDLSFEDIGFCYWNVSDNYALLKDGKGLYENHIKFERFLSSAASKYIYWLCNDGTQRFTLEKDGYSDFWWDLYRKAVSVNSECSILQFSSHRVALALNPMFPHSPNHLSFALNAVEQFLKDFSTDDNYEFYNAVFYMQKTRFTNKTDSILELAYPFLSKLAQPIESTYLAGEWHKYTASIPTANQAILVLNTAINALIYADKKSEAKELYASAIRHGMLRNTYIEKRI